MTILRKHILVTKTCCFKLNYFANENLHVKIIFLSFLIFKTENTTFYSKQRSSVLFFYSVFAV